MPTTRRRRTRRPNTVTLQSLDIPVQLDLLVGVRFPPRTPFDAEQLRFTSYTDFLDTYRAVREDFLAHLRNAGTGFAEELHQAALAQPKADVEALGRTIYAARYEC